MNSHPEWRRVSLSEMDPAPYNPRTISEEALSGLTSSIDRFGLMKLIIWNEKSGNIVGGHQRYKVLRESGEEETNVVVVSLDYNDEVALNLSLNNPKAKGEFTQDILELLKKTEVMVGNAFKDLQLDSLHDRMKKISWEPKKKDFTEPEESGGEGSDSSGSPPDGGGEDEDASVKDAGDSDSPDAIIVCPKCSSMWKMMGNKVIKDGTEEQSLGSEDCKVLAGEEV